MADQERFLDDEEGGSQGEEIEVGKKVGFLPSFILRILKWVAIITGMLLLVIITVVVLFNYLMENQAGVYTGDITVGMEVAPPPETLQYYKNLDPIRGLTIDKPPYLFTAQVDIGYEKNNNALTTEINERSSRIHNTILIYLSKKSANDLHLKDAEKLQQELTREVNRIMRSGKIKLILFKELQTFQS
ncbi:MAG: flagellar basal body-associated FliL family protein [Spirochaetales bacterium]|nr:flagellar basal body-associated FliL family protein [Spirochaetales bacterium]